MKQNKSTPSGLLEEFSPASPEQWRDAAEKLLKGVPYDKVMTHQTPEGIRLQPIFWKDVLDQLPAADTYPGFDGYLRGTRASGYRQQPWEIAQELPYGTPKAFNDAARADLMRGQNALNVILDIASQKGLDPDSAEIGEVGACGLSLACLNDMQVAFAEIVPEAVGIHIQSGCSGLAVGALLFAWLQTQEIDPKQVKGSLGMDPIAVQAAAGTLPAARSELFDEQFILAEFCANKAAAIQSIGVSSLPYHQAGASAVDELGIALATGCAYLRELTERGLDIDAAAQQIRFSLAIGPNFFMEIAKLRAARMLWAQVVAAFGGSAAAQKICMHARTGLYNKTCKDPYVNMLRTTTEAMSGVIGGVDSLCVGHFDEVLGLPDSFSRRISRNTQIILQEECELSAVVDPAGGAWAVEWLTDQVAAKSWDLLQTIEGRGGIIAALEDGFIAATVAQTAADREQQFNRRRISLVGTNVYPNLDEAALTSHLPNYTQLRATRATEIARSRVALDEDADARIMYSLGQLLTVDRADLVTAMIHAIRDGATLGEVSRTLRSSVNPPAQSQALPVARLAAKYEALRDASARFKDRYGHGPKLFLCNLGTLRRHKARADFSKGFFQTGGFEVLSPGGFESTKDAVAALAKSSAGITIVCGMDDDYVEQFPAYARAIKATLPDVQILLAGHPGDHEAAYREAGMDDYIYLKSDNYALNRRYLSHLGVV